MPATATRRLLIWWVSVIKPPPTLRHGLSAPPPTPQPPSIKFFRGEREGFGRPRKWTPGEISPSPRKYPGPSYFLDPEGMSAISPGRASRTRGYEARLFIRPRRGRSIPAGTLARVRDVWAFASGGVASLNPRLMADMLRHGQASK